MGRFQDQLKLIKALEKQGFRVEQTNKCHFKVYSPDGRTMTVLGGTASDHRTQQNQRAILRRMGFRE